MMRNKPFIMTFCVILVCGLITSCQAPISPTVDPDVTASTQLPTSEHDNLIYDKEDVETLIIDYMKTTGPYERTYIYGVNIDNPQEKDQRIDNISFMGEATTGETTGVAFLVECSYYDVWHPDDPAPTWRQNETGTYLILGRDAKGEYYEVRGICNRDENTDISKIILEVTYDLMDIDVALWREGYSSPVGPGSEVRIFSAESDGSPTIEVLEGWEPIYHPGDYWTQQSWDGFSATCYHNGNVAEVDADTYQVYTVNTTRTDLYTNRNIHVGSSREEVLKAYPGILDTYYWNSDAPDFPGNDYLWYCDDPEGFGAAILFFFSGDVVSQIRLNNMFN